MTKRKVSKPNKKKPVLEPTEVRKSGGSGRRVPVTFKSFLPMLTLILVTGGVVSFAPFPYSFTESATVPFETVEQEDGDMELGDSKELQSGRDGKKEIEFEAMQNFWSWLFKLGHSEPKEVSSRVVEKPVDKIVARGTREVQSSDETSVHVPINPGSAVPNRGPVPAGGEGCTETSIPHQTVYRDASWLDKGETSVSAGLDGTISSCGWRTEPRDEVVLRGTAEPSSGSSSPADGRYDHAAYDRCLSTYNSAMSQIEASESQGVAGLTDLKRRVESQFTRCKRAAGYY